MNTTIIFKLTMSVFLLSSPLLSKTDPKTRHGDKDAKDSSICLEIKGRFSKPDHTNRNVYLVELLLDNEVVEAISVRDGGSFKFFMKKNKWYSVKIIEEGREAKLLLFDTHLPVIYDNYIYVLSFEVDNLLTDDEAKQLDPDALDFPIALFDFDNRFDEFNFNETYRANILNKLFETVIASHETNPY
jgi:hypothetical protein